MRENGPEPDARNDQQQLPETKGGFDKSKISPEQQMIITNFGGTINDIPDSGGRPQGIRISFPASMKAHGGDWKRMERKPINGQIILDGNTATLSINKPLLIGDNSALVVRIISTDNTGKRDYADIYIPDIKLPERVLSPDQQIHVRLGNILNDQNSRVNIMQNIDYIVANKDKLTQNQWIYFRDVIQFIIQGRTGLDFVPYNNLAPNQFALRYGPNHHSIRSIDYQLGLPLLTTLEKTELLRRRDELLKIPMSIVYITSANWESFNFTDPYFLKEVKR